MLSELLTEQKVKDKYPVIFEGRESHFYFKITPETGWSFWFFNPETMKRPMPIMFNIPLQVTGKYFKDDRDKACLPHPVYELPVLNREMIDELNKYLPTNADYSRNCVKVYLEDIWFYDAFYYACYEYSQELTKLYSKK